MAVASKRLGRSTPLRRDDTGTIVRGRAVVVASRRCCAFRYTHDDLAGRCTLLAPRAGSILPRRTDTVGAGLAPGGSHVVPIAAAFGRTNDGRSMKAGVAERGSIGGVRRSPRGSTSRGCQGQRRDPPSAPSAHRVLDAPLESRLDARRCASSANHDDVARSLPRRDHLLVHDGVELSSERSVRDQLAGPGEGRERRGRRRARPSGSGKRGCGVRPRLELFARAVDAPWIVAGDDARRSRRGSPHGPGVRSDRPGGTTPGERAGSPPPSASRRRRRRAASESRSS